MQKKKLVNLDPEMLTFIKCTEAPYILCTMPQTQAQQDIEPNFPKRKERTIKIKIRTN